MQESTITSKGQTTLPRQVRQALDLQPGDKVRYLILDDRQVRLVRARAVTEMAGTLHRARRVAVSLEAMEAAVAERAAVQ